MPALKKSPQEKEIELADFMEIMPSKKSNSGYQISEDLRKKWKDLGPVSLESIKEKLNGHELNFDLELGQSSNAPQIIGQLDKMGDCQGIGKKIQPYSLYEGQFKNNKRHGYGRVIYSSYYYEGYWSHDRQHGLGKKVDHRGREQEGQWDRNNFLGEIDGEYGDEGQ